MIKMDPGMLVRLAMLRVKCKQLGDFLAGTASGSQTQRSILMRQIASTASSRFGRDHGFSTIRGIEDFRRQLPVTGYEAFRPYIEEVSRGNVEAMFSPRTKVLMFAITSGTTDKPKMLPVTDTFYRNYKRGWQYWGTGVYRDYPHLLGMKTLQLSSRYDVDHTQTGVPCGNISGMAAETRPFYIGTLFILPSAAIRITDHAAKHYVALRLSMASDQIGMVITANPSTLIEIAKTGDRRKAELIRDIFDGTIDESVNVPGEVRRALQGRIKANPRRARQLERLAEQNGNLYPKDMWPHLSLVAVWTGGSVGIYLSQLKQYFGDVPIRDHGISASEGRMTIPLTNHSPEGVLDYTSHYYEFIPEEEHGTDQPTVLEAHELETDRNYFILLTTAAGLYRYDIHDVVRCHGFEGQVPILSFLNKGKHFSSFTGEKISEHQVVQAMRQTMETLQMPGCTFTLAPRVTEGRPQYHLLIEDGEHARIGERLAAEFQRQLEQVNVEYGDKCHSGRIDSVAVSVIPNDAFARLRQRKSVERGNFEEYKHPCLTSDPAFLERILSEETGGVVA